MRNSSARGRSIGAPFVGAVAASLVVAELLRLVVGHDRYEMISCYLRDLDGRTVVRGDPWAMFNRGHSSRLPEYARIGTI